MRKLDDAKQDKKEKRTALVGKGGAGDPTLRYLRNYEASGETGRPRIAYIYHLVSFIL